MDNPLSVEHLRCALGGLVAVNDVSFNVGKGQITALIGPNGAARQLSSTASLASTSQAVAAS